MNFQPVRSIPQWHLSTIIAIMYIFAFICYWRRNAKRFFFSLKSLNLSKSVSRQDTVLVENIGNFFLILIKNQFVVWYCKIFFQAFFFFSCKFSILLSHMLNLISQMDFHSSGSTHLVAVKVCILSTYPAFLASHTVWQPSWLPRITYSNTPTFHSTF